VVQTDWMNREIMAKSERTIRAEREVLCSNRRCGQIGNKDDKRRKRKTIVVPSDYPKGERAYCSGACAAEDRKLRPREIDGEGEKGGPNEA
jgi:hypothetical protein